MFLSLGCEPVRSSRGPLLWFRDGAWPLEFSARGRQFALAGATSDANMTEPRPSQMVLYRRWLSQNRGLDFPDYEALRQWSVRGLDAFWQSIWDYFDLQSPTPHTAVLAQRKMPGAIWFPGAQVNYASQVLRHV